MDRNWQTRRRRSNLDGFNHPYCILGGGLLFSFSLSLFSSFFSRNKHTHKDYLSEMLRHYLMKLGAVNIEIPFQ